VIATPANINDTTPADDLIRGDERVVWADAAYHTHARQAALKARGIKPRLMRRANRHHPKLPPRLTRYNRMIARHRAACTARRAAGQLNQLFEFAGQGCCNCRRVGDRRKGQRHHDNAAALRTLQDPKVSSTFTTWSDLSQVVHCPA